MKSTLTGMLLVMGIAHAMAQFSETVDIINDKDDRKGIVGGTEARRGDYPFQVALLDNGRFFCGGSLLNNVSILTAAHCVAAISNVSRLSVLLQVHRLSPLDSTAVRRRVRRIVINRDYNTCNTQVNDVAILTMDAPVQFSSTLSPVSLPALNDTRTFADLDTVVIGWGTLREGGTTISPTLQQVTVRVQNNTECRRRYGCQGYKIVESSLCAAAPGKDSCQGDSGGPLLYRNPSDGRWMQVGVVSWGIGCARDPFPGIYARVTSYRAWIAANM